jgi:hypothetical protein
MSARLGIFVELAEVFGPSEERVGFGVAGEVGPSGHRLQKLLTGG